MSEQCNSGLTLMERLKESTRSMHDSAESSKFQSLLGRGELPPGPYADYLEQLYLVHSTLEREIRKRGSANSFGDTVSDEQLQEPFLRKDLESFDRNVENLKTLPSTERLLRLMQNYSEACPPALLGMHYVLLGSKHGGKFIAKNCSEKYNIQLGHGGVVYFDPYGQNFMPIWRAFKESMNNLNLTPAEAEKVCAAAGVMFMAVTEIGNELMPVATL